MNLLKAKIRPAALFALIALTGLMGQAHAQADLSSGKPAQQPVTRPQMDGLGRLQSINVASGIVTVGQDTFELSKYAVLADARHKPISASAFRAGELVAFVFEFNSSSAAEPGNIKPENGMVVEVRKVGGGF